MLLAIDTATRAVSLALHDGARVLAESTWTTANHHTIELTPAVGELLGRSRITVRDLTGLAVALGPGSYTGLRIGLSLAKGIALGAAPPLPLIGVPTLDIVAAAQPPLAPQLCAVAQAGRGRVNAGFYTWGDDADAWQPAGDPAITTWAALIEQIDAPTLLAGEVTAEVRDTLAKANPALRVSPPALCLRRAGVLAELAWQRMRAGAPTDARAVAPTYLT